VPLIALIAPFAQVARSTNRSTTAAPDPLVPLLYVTSQQSPACIGASEAWCVRSPGTSRTLPYVNHVDDLTRISSVSSTSGTTDDQIGHRSEVYDR
jgi:hypothetical protein